MYNRKTSIIGTINFNPKSNILAINSLLINIFPLILRNQPAKIHKNKVFNGINKFDVAKSRKSKIPLPAIVKLLRTPKDKLAGIAIDETMQNSNILDFILERCNLSINAATDASRILIPEVIAAADKSKKNAIATMFPCGI
jgi:hypothetical protein